MISAGSIVVPSLPHTAVDGIICDVVEPVDRSLTYRYLAADDGRNDGACTHDISSLLMP